jgi:hypothetical protein
VGDEVPEEAGVPVVELDLECLDRHAETASWQAATIGTAPTILFTASAPAPALQHPLFVARDAGPFAVAKRSDGARVDGQDWMR